MAAERWVKHASAGDGEASLPQLLLTMPDETRCGRRVFGRVEKLNRRNGEFYSTSAVGDRSPSGHVEGGAQRIV